MRRVSSDIIKNSHIYSSIKEEEVFIYWAYFDVFCGFRRGFCERFDNHSQLDN